MGPVKVYGAEWCGDTQATIEFLEGAGVDYEFHDVDEEASADEWVRERNRGSRKLPTVEVGGVVLSVPADEALESALRQNGML